MHSPLDDRMQHDQEPLSSRREFFRSAARGMFLAVFTATGALLVIRKQVDASAPGCAKDRFCADCGRLAFCRLPPAPAARLAQKGPVS